MFPNAGIMAAGAGGAAPGQRTFTFSQSFVVPDGVTSIGAVAINGGEPGTDFGEGTYRSGAGGALAYRNNIEVTPAETLTVEIDIFNRAFLRRGGVTLLNSNQSMTGQTWFAGGAYQQSNSPNMAGAGAAGYTSAGQAAGLAGSSPKGGGGTSLFGGGPGALAGAAPTGTGGSYGGGGAIVDGTTPGGGPAGLRIIWGDGRAFPNTKTGDF